MFNVKVISLTWGGMTTTSQCRNLIRFSITILNKILKNSFILRLTTCKMFIGILEDLWDLVETLSLNWTHLHGSVMMASAFALTNSNVTTSPSVLKKKVNHMVFPFGDCKAKSEAILFELRRHPLHLDAALQENKENSTFGASHAVIYSWLPKKAQLLIFWYLKSGYKKSFSGVRSNTFQNIPAGNHTQAYGCGPSLSLWFSCLL